ncbi:Copia protein, partial [Mucuna pruriens]
MQEELNKFQKNDIWKLVSPLKEKSIISTKWIFINKLDHDNSYFRNLTRLVAQSYSQHMGINFTKTLSPIAMLEGIHILLSFINQMDVKCTFLNGIINEEVFVKQPSVFESDVFLNHVFKLKKTLYGLKQAPRAWYDKLSSFFMKNGFQRGKVDTTLFHKNYVSYFIIVQIYIDDIIFYATNESLFGDFSELMQKEFKMSMIGELKFFLRLQIKEAKDGIYIHQPKYIKELLKKYNLEDCKPMSSLMHPTSILSLDETDKKVDQTSYKDTTNLGLCYKRYEQYRFKGYNDANFARDRIERKGTIGGCHFIGSNLVSWSSKRQGTIVLSMTKAEYISVAQMLLIASMDQESTRGS